MKLSKFFKSKIKIPQLSSMYEKQIENTCECFIANMLIEKGEVKHRIVLFTYINN